MSDVPASREMIQVEDCTYRSAVSEAMMLKVGGQCNFLNTRHIETREFCLNGIYNGVVPNLDIDGGFIFEFDAEIVDIFIKNRTAGSSGTTELDVKWKPQGSGAWTTIFDASTGGVTPKITSSAAAGEACGIGDMVAGFVAAVPTKTKFVARSMLKCDLLQAMAGNPTGAVLVVHYRPV